MQRAQPTAAHLLMIFQLLLLFFLSALTHAHYLLPSMPISTENEAVDVPRTASSHEANIDGLQDNVPQWKHSSLVDDGDDVHMQSKMARRKPKFALTKQRAVEIDQSKAVILHVGLPQEKQDFQLLDDGGKHDVKLESTSETSLHFKVYEANHLQEEAAQEATFESLWTDSSTTTQLKQNSEDTHDGAKHVDDQHTVSSSTANAAQGEHSLWQPLHNGSQHATKHAPSSTPASPSEEVKLLPDNVAQGEHVFLLDDGGEDVPTHAQTDSPGAPSSPNSKGDQQKVQILHGNAAQGEYSFLLDDDRKYRYPKAKATSLDGDLVDQTIEVDHVKLKEQKGHQVFVDREKQSPDDEIRMVVSESPDQSLRPSGIYQARRGRFASCIFHPKVCEHRMSEAGRHTLNPTVEYNGGHVAAGGLLRLQNPKRPACCRGKCVDLNRERLHCGRCHSPCGLTQACCNGKCTDLSTDDLNCGQCGQACPDLMTPCQFGMCGYY